MADQPLARGDGILVLRIVKHGGVLAPLQHHLDGLVEFFLSLRIQRVVQRLQRGADRLAHVVEKRRTAGQHGTVEHVPRVGGQPLGELVLPIEQSRVRHHVRGVVGEGRIQNRLGEGSVEESAHVRNLRVVQRLDQHVLFKGRNHVGTGRDDVKPGVTGLQAVDHLFVRVERLDLHAAFVLLLELPHHAVVNVIAPRADAQHRLGRAATRHHAKGKNAPRD